MCSDEELRTECCAAGLRSANFGAYAHLASVGSVVWSRCWIRMVTQKDLAIAMLQVAKKTHRTNISPEGQAVGLSPSSCWQR